jgi:7,8-dihydroneopterin aldolase/epimerase/oxygenase
MSRKEYVFLKDVKFYAYHGVGEQERTVGNYFIVNIRLGVDFTKAAEEDDLEGSINYAEVYNKINVEMKQSSLLLEHVANRIVERLLKDYPQLLSIDLELEKLNPPMGADIRSAGVEIHWVKE